MRKLLFAFLLLSIPVLPQEVQRPKLPQRQTAPPPPPPDIRIQPDSATLGLESERQEGCRELGEVLKQRLDQERNPTYTLAEYNAYVAASSETDSQVKIKELKEFVSKFPHSFLLSNVNQLYLAACRDSENRAQTEQRAEESKPEPKDVRRYAMFDGNTWPGQNGLTNLARPCGAPPYPYASPNSFDNNIEPIARDLEGIRRTWRIARRVYIAPLGSPVVNAWTINSPNFAIICVPFGIQSIFGGNLDELEALIAHEMGHAIDTECYNYARRSVAGQRSCEARADAYAFAALVGLHREPYAMAGMFGRLEMFYGDVSTSILARLSNVLGGNHPITPDRINSMRTLLIQYERTHQTSLPPVVP